MPDIVVTITVPVAQQARVSTITGAANVAELKQWIINKYKEEARRYDESQAIRGVADDDSSLT